MATIDAFEAGAPLGAPTPPLEDRERSVLAELAREMDAWVTFQGLRRQLGVHQQALARTLRRLESQGLLAHDGKGYQLTDQGSAALRGERVAPPRRDVLPLLQALLPPHVQPGDVARQLSRRWFGDLRWYGQSEGPGETSLHWMAGKARVTVRVAPGSVHLEVENDPGEPARAYSAVRPLLGALAELYDVGPKTPGLPSGVYT